MRWRLLDTRLVDDRHVHLWEFPTTDELSRGAVDEAVRHVVTCALGRRGASMLRRGAFGAPRLAGLVGPSGPGAGGTAPGRQRCWVSAAGSHERVLVAITLAGPVGIDLERTFDGPAPAPSASWLTDYERAEVAQLPERERPSALLRSWTRKEAVGKALGVGLQLAPNRIGAGVLSTGPLVLDGQRQPGWLLSDLRLGDGWVASMALRPVRRGSRPATTHRTVTLGPTTGR